jgi:eukaryotic-like serine/threonine-protein kinase
MAQSKLITPELPTLNVTNSPAVNDNLAELPCMTSIAYPAEPSEIERYRLGRLINAGGMGVVVEAVEEATERRVAVKFLAPRDFYRHARLRFWREVFALRSLRHPNTVRIEDWGVSNEDRPFLVMEYLDGVSLQELVELEGPQSAKRVLGILQQICGSIGEAHALGMAHRDLKPGNVMLTTGEDGSDRLKVIDFGLVKLPALADSLTIAGEVMGTPGYTPPESWAGSETSSLGRARRECDYARGDVYGIGLIGYHLLTGEQPPEPEELLERGNAPLLAGLRQHAPEWLVRVLKRCLYGNPSRRFADAQALLAALVPPGRSLPSWRGATLLCENARHRLQALSRES